MRKSHVIAFVVASLVSSATVVQAQSAAPSARAARHAVRGGIGAGGALRGIALSDAEKASLKAIHARFVAEGKTLREKQRPAREELRAARQKGDTVGMKAVRERNQGARDEVKALRARQQAEIRAALTPEHQKAFDANVAERATRHARFAKQGGRHGKRMKGGHKGHSGERELPRAGTNG